jgi:hypothetical protein
MSSASIDSAKKPKLSLRDYINLVDLELRKDCSVEYYVNKSTPISMLIIPNILVMINVDFIARLMNLPSLDNVFIATTSFKKSEITGSRSRGKDTSEGYIIFLKEVPEILSLTQKENFLPQHNLANTYFMELDENIAIPLSSISGLAGLETPDTMSPYYEALITVSNELSRISVDYRPKGKEIRVNDHVIEYSCLVFQKRKLIRFFGVLNIEYTALKNILYMEFNSSLRKKMLIHNEGGHLTFECINTSSEPA